MAVRPNNRTPFRIIAPVVSAALLATLAGFGTLRPAAPKGIENYVERVVTAIDDTPYRVDSWTGRDLSAPPTEAVDMLKPSRVLHRGYAYDNSHAQTRIVIVHCPDVRDMAGHHPPNCYPATGWTSAGTETFEVRAFGKVQTLALHRFDRTDAGARRSITVASGFVVPGNEARLIPTMDELRALSENRRRTKLGAAQLQIIIDSDADQEDIGKVARTFLPALEPVVRRVTEGVE